MIEKKAYFTPSPETAPKLVAQLLFADAKEKPCITFYVEENDTSGDVVPKLAEVTIEPITGVFATEKGFEVTGSRPDVIGVIAKLSVDTTVEPPVALYSEA